MKNPDKYIINWESTFTGKTGEGKTLFSWDHADDIARKKGREFTGINHWPVQKQRMDK